MPPAFERIAVIGAGTMGAGIAGQIANAGQDVLLLDLTEELARAGVERLLRSEPPALVEKSVADRISVGALDEAMASLGSRDWIVEAVVERLDVKRALYRRLHEIIAPDCAVTSNTSTIPIRLLVEGLPEDFRRRFAITHWFNPVRYMRLLELVRGEATDPALVERLADYNARMLGKGVVRCDDTPGFLGNRVGVYALQVGIDEARRTGVPIEVADALMGRPMGIPKTGVFGLYDLIGVDLMADVVRSLAGILPPGDAFHAVADNAMVDGMVAAGLTGDKGGGGFYRRDGTGARLARGLGDGEYGPVGVASPARAVAAAADLAAGREPLTALVAGDDAEASFCRGSLGRTLGYAAGLLGEVTDSPQAIDDAMKLGFNWLRGPFEMIDALGASTVRELVREAGMAVPVALEAEDGPFYAVADGTVAIRQADGTRRPPALPAGAVRWELERRAASPIASNAAASLYAIEGDLRLVEFHSKANALTDESMAIVAAAAEDHGAGILVHNAAQHYSAGVDLNAFLALIDAGDLDGIDAFLARFQEAVLALKYSPVPVVGAPSGLALGGGFEVLLHCDALVAHVNSVMGLVESGVGLLPAGGGVTATYRRWLESGLVPADAAWKAWLNLGYGATGSSPPLAAKLRYFLPGRDEAVIDRDALYPRGVARLRELGPGYAPPVAPTFELAGDGILARMDEYMAAGVARGDFTAMNRAVAMTIGGVFCADGPAGRPAGRLDERALYARERAGFVSLARTAGTRASIARLLGVA